MSESCSGDRIRLPSAANTLWWSYLLSQGRVDLQKETLNAHFGRNPDQLAAARDMLDNPNEFDEFYARVARHVTGPNHTDKKGKDQPIVEGDIREEVRKTLPKMVRSDPDIKRVNYFDIGQVILERDFNFYKAGRSRKKPGSTYGILHRDASQLVHFGILFPESDTTKIESVATHAAAAILGRAEAVAQRESSVNGSDTSISKELLTILGWQTLWLPEFEEQLKPFVAQAQAFRETVIEANR